jgi:hypothetical protein
VRVTQRVDPGALDAFFERPPRAAIAFAAAGEGIETVPVSYRRRAGRHLVGVARGEGAAPAPGSRAVLLIDDGRYWFELRAVTLRGRLAAAPEPPPEAGGELVWLELVPEHAVAWDYGRLHEEPEP